MFTIHCKKKKLKELLKTLNAVYTFEKIVLLPFHVKIAFIQTSSKLATTAKKLR